jgi:hypothetical protein
MSLAVTEERGHAHLPDLEISTLSFFPDSRAFNVWLTEMPNILGVGKVGMPPLFDNRLVNLPQNKISVLLQNCFSTEISSSHELRWTPRLRRLLKGIGKLDQFRFAPGRSKERYANW